MNCMMLHQLTESHEKKLFQLIDETTQVHIVTKILNADYVDYYSDKRDKKAR